MTNAATKNSTSLVKKLARCEPLAELAHLVEATPQEFRVAIVTAAMRLEPSGSLEQSYLVGFVRAALANILGECLRPTSIARLTDLLDGVEDRILPVVSRLASAGDLARVQLVLCELLATVAEENEAFSRG